MTRNSSQHMDGIPFSELPPTFMDAVTTIIELGIRHIWIDSLCIIQDDPQDWQREAANMAAIYELAEITIAATWGADSLSGCFHDYIRPFAVSVRAECEDTRVGKGELTCNLVIRPQHQSWSGGMAKLSSNTLLGTRKWTLQEEVLSPRILSFSEAQMRWTCSDGSRNEDTLPVHHSDANLLIPMRQMDVMERSALRRCLVDGWRHIVDEYSRRNITFASDKLAAIAGMTRVFAEVSGEVDILGMWKNHLTSNLLWNSDGMHCKIDEVAVKALNIPTWSWLKSSNTIDIPFPPLSEQPPHDRNEDSLIRIVESIVEWDGVPMTSKILQARIKLFGLLLPIIKVKQSPDRRMNPMSLSVLPIGDCMCFSSGVHVQLPSGEILKLLTDHWDTDECRQTFEHQIYCLLFSCGEWDTRSKYDRMKSSGMPHSRFVTMVVGLADDAEQRPRFIRLGTASIGGLPLDRLSELQQQEIELV